MLELCAVVLVLRFCGVGFDLAWGIVVLFIFARARYFCGFWLCIFVLGLHIVFGLGLFGRLLGFSYCLRLAVGVGVVAGWGAREAY